MNDAKESIMAHFSLSGFACETRIRVFFIFTEYTSIVPLNTSREYLLSEIWITLRHNLMRGVHVVVPVLSKDC